MQSPYSAVCNASPAFSTNERITATTGQTNMLFIGHYTGLLRPVQTVCLASISFKRKDFYRKNENGSIILIIVYNFKLTHIFETIQHTTAIPSSSPLFSPHSSSFFSLFNKIIFNYYFFFNNKKYFCV